jgi:hypothetical protein
MKRLTILACVLALLSGCASMQWLCDNKAEAEAYKAKIGGLLQTVQVGYSQVATIAGQQPSPAVGVAVMAVDQALNVLGSLYYDRVCPTLADLKTAEEMAKNATVAKVAVLAKAK